ncbi:MAG: hypothetical protein CL667_09580 [Balneola sp.]|jgi:ACR3 family arsenite efflux pump ArsB|nr:hypothetical protein [Balneola sp.]HAD49935.1 hypothetical protein [Algoriphagus sp.]|tara:strand:+ start:927 stop:1118 length:192 start_codon:yes stop_codon:yes gene_type:complete
MDSFFLELLIYTIISLLICFAFRENFQQWKEQDWKMKLILFHIGVSTIGLFISLIVVAIKVLF